jgi:hypothetical protein
MKKFIIPLLLVIIVVVFVISRNVPSLTELPKANETSSSSSTSSKEGDIAEGVSDVNKEQLAKVKEEEKKKAEYTLTAVKGDSYIVLVRSMITKKLRERGLKIDNIQRIYIEGVMAESRNYPRLEIGDKVTLDETEFDSLLSKSYKLSSKSRAIWNTYAKKVRFDSI